MTYPAARSCPARIESLAFYLPGDPVSVDSLEISDDMRSKLPGTGQEFTYIADEDSTEMSVAAARNALERADLSASDIGLVISAPTLTTSYGLEIPAIALRAALGLENAECLNLAQGCVGFLAGIRLAAGFLAADDGPGHVLVVTACKASTLMDSYNHGSFFWADAAAATVLSAVDGPGLHVRAYAENSSDRDWGAMRFRHGDGQTYKNASPDDDLKLVVDFHDERAQMEYILGEQKRCEGLIAALMDSGGLGDNDIDAIFMPSIGANRVPHLLQTRKSLRAKVKSDFRYAHMGGVDALFFLDCHFKSDPPGNTANYLAMTPAYTAQWGGLLLQAKV